MKYKELFLEYLQIVLGSFIGALSLTMFLIPNKVAAGGVSGLATVLYYLFKLPVGWMMLLFNIPLFLSGIIFLGKGVGIKTLVGSLLFSVFTELTVNFPVVTRDLMLSAVYGGIILGIGLGIVFRVRGSTGGTDLAAMILNHFIPSISVGQGILIIDFFVIILSGIAFNWELAMYAWIALFVSSKVIDLIQEGFNYAKAVYIISNETEEISQKILKEMERGLTFIKAEGGFTRQDKNVLLCVITRLEVSRLKNIVHQTDPRAFVIVHDVHEVLGEGFSYKND
ncbi:YitT family protein [Tepidanaerobacter acetatoxydans]|uniref:YitT family protein n=1 Tax=Tepidanaerobacter acetatoxydans TaxID=499229 RepID=UPI001BD4C3EC|nr:YitT family protein [Tepidanaerobacter acetatoxydans]